MKKAHGLVTVGSIQWSNGSAFGCGHGLRAEIRKRGRDPVSGTQDDSAVLTDRFAVPHHFRPYDVVVGFARIQHRRREDTMARGRLHGVIVHVKLGVIGEINHQLGRRGLTR